MSDTEQNKDSYKDTVFLPKTDFPMRGNLPQKEPEILAKWQEMDLYAKMREADADKEKWILHDGPPYANGDIHMGHALNKILKDVSVKTHAMLGYNTPYVPGWDCHGLPIEWKIEEKYRNAGKDKDEVEALQFREECRAFAQKWVDIQSDQFQRLGVTGDWKDPYLTMTNRAESKIVREIHKFATNGGLYRGAKPVMWSVVEKTALAEAEVEYKEHKSVTIWIRFPVEQTNVELLKGADIVIWTTTPWTMPSNRAIAFGENIEYGVYKINDPLPNPPLARGREEASQEAEGGGVKICIATSLAESLKEAAKIESWELLGTFMGSEVTGTVCAHPLKQRHPEMLAKQRHPEMLALKDLKSNEPDSSAQALQNDSEYIYDFPVPLLLGDFVTDDAGTGFVHIAPGHGEDDFYLIMDHNLKQRAWEINENANDADEMIESIKLHKDKLIEITDNVTDDGKFREHVPLFAGLEVYTQEGKLGDGNFAILKAMQEAGKLLAKGSLRHEYPHSWRSKAPLIFRTTPQWFIAMDSEAKPGDSYFLEKSNCPRSQTLRQNALQAIKDTRWVPAKGEARIRSMIENRPDWCISRQRSWGVPIALFVHKDTGEILNDEAVLGRIGDIFETEGSDAWWSRNAQDFLGNDYSSDDYEQVFDIVDVWFESGSTHAFVVEDREDLGQRADLYLEGSDQHRGWFHSSLLESVGTRGVAPYKAVLTHGFVLDQDGYKMSKSLGNVVDPLKLMDEFGADIIRLWALTCDYSEDIKIGQDTIKQTGDLYRRIRNTLRFLLGALEGFTAEESVFARHCEEGASPTRQSTDCFAGARNDDVIKSLPELEQLVLHQLYEMDKKITSNIEDFDFMRMTKALHDFCNQELSSLYFDIRKDRLYCDAPDSFERRATRSVMAVLFDCLTSWLAPVLVFTAEEAWQHRPEGVFGEEESIHLREFPDVPENWHNPALAGKWFALRDLRKSVLEAIEPMRADKTIRSSLEALPVITLDENMAKAIEGIALDDLFITSQVQVSGGDKTAVKIEKALGEKCERCWKVLPEVTENGDICNRCAAAVKHKKAA